MTLQTRLGRAPLIGPALAGVAAAMAMIPLLPLLRPLFSVPGNGIGYVTVHAYPKGWDYAVIAILFAVGAGVTFAAAVVWPGQAAPTSPPSDPVAARPRAAITIIALAICSAILTFPARYDPYAFLDPYHEGESLSPASVMMAGGAPYRDVWFMHGVGIDGGIDLLVMGKQPSPLPGRKVRAVLSAITLAVLVPIAAEVCMSWLAVVVGTLASLAAIAAGMLTTFPFFRLLPLLLAIWLTLLFIRTGRRRFVVAAAIIASAGVLWSLDVGLFAVAGLWGWMIARNLLADGAAKTIGSRAFVACAAATLLTPPILLLMIGGDIRYFFLDSFARLPECFDAIYSLPAPPLPVLSSIFTPAGLMEWLDSPSARYYVPPIAYGVWAAVAFVLAARGDRRGAEALLLIALTSFVELRSAAGRVAWSHTRFAVPLLGIALVAFALEPLLRHAFGHRGLRRWSRVALAAALVLLFVPYLEWDDNTRYLTGYWTTFRERLGPKPGTVPFPVPRARDLYTYTQEAVDLEALYRFSQSMPEGPIFDFSGEKDLYYMLARPASTRCHDIPYLSDPALGREALAQLEQRPPVFVVIKGIEVLANIDGISNAQRTPWLSDWLDRHYPQRISMGRFVVGIPR